MQQGKGTTVTVKVGEGEGKEMCVSQGPCKVNATPTTPPTTPPAATPAATPAAGGASRKTKKLPQQRVFYNKSARASLVYIQEGTKRKYIKVGGSVVYLDTIRGKYKIAK